MIHVVADSNVYRADPRREKAAFKALGRLAQGKHLTLHIPEIVRREFLSQEEVYHQDHVRAIEGALRSLGKRPLDAAAFEILKKVSDAGVDLTAKLKTSGKKEFDDWSKGISAVNHPIDSSHGAKVMDAYFE
ncbi:MAG: hypothetical protein ABL955_11250, partial [Elusimicrobiota bacterium]